MKTLTIVDAFGFFFRSFYALPPLTSKSGEPTGLLTGFVNFVSRLSKEHETDYLVFCADSKGPSFRAELYGEYKANRPEPPAELRAQIPIALNWIEKMGFPLLSESGLEADDLIASLTREAKKAGLRVRIISHDKDMYQLIDDGRVVIYDAVKQREVDARACEEKFGVAPEDFIQFQSLLGDSSDNVPGVKGIGEKTAAKLINEYKTLENLYAHLDEIKPDRVRGLLETGREMAFLSRQLVTLRDHALENVAFERFTLPDNPVLAIADELTRYDIGAVLKRAQGATKTAAPVFNAPAAPKVAPPAQAALFEAVLVSDEAELQKIIAAIPKNAVLAFDTETDSLDATAARLVGFSFAWEENRGYYAAIGHNYLGVPDQVGLSAAKTAIQTLFEQTRIVGQNLKFDLHVLEHALGLKNLPVFADTMILAWLIDPGRAVGLDALAKEWLGHEMIAFKTVTKGLKDFSQVDVESACNYAAEDAVMTLRLYPRLLSHLNLQEPALSELAQQVELPFMRVLMRMEDAGVMIDTAFFAQLKTQMDGELAGLQKRIHELAGESFNINSTQQLGMVLFERLGLPAGKKTKTGYSTDESVLLELQDRHPIVSELLNYRELAKLKSTYIDPLLLLASGKADHRVSTHFSQVGTATGRLSSSEPNLQNIPTRTETGRQIRQGFIAKPGCVLIGADYSQIELRLLAHFSQDKTLIGAFEAGRDIHMETARVIFGDEQAKEKRNLAKSVNFGLLYGMGSRKLAADTGISATEAKAVIEHYFASFPTVKSYLESIKHEAHETGFVTTLLGRRRYFDFTNARAQFIAMFEREAVNTRFQGSAADLIKLAMIRLHERFKNDDRATMILQIHDELLFEVEAAYADEAARMIADEMKQAFSLRVPLEVSVNRGQSWAELK
ncbi:MAG: DNA polymerase I [Campylobacterales bacterium]